MRIFWANEDFFFGHFFIHKKVLFESLIIRRAHLRSSKKFWDMCNVHELTRQKRRQLSGEVMNPKGGIDCLKGMAGE